jgi:hypothetical protein
VTIINVLIECQAFTHSTQYPQDRRSPQQRQQEASDGNGAAGGGRSAALPNDMGLHYSAPGQDFREGNRPFPSPGAAEPGANHARTIIGLTRIPQVQRSGSPAALYQDVERRAATGGAYDDNGRGACGREEGRRGARGLSTRIQHRKVMAAPATYTTHTPHIHHTYTTHTPHIHHTYTTHTPHIHHTYIRHINGGGMRQHRVASKARRSIYHWYTFGVYR